MHSSDTALRQPFFHHIYVEEGAFSYPFTQTLLARFTKAAVVPILHYKDVFCRGHQDILREKQSPALILAVKSAPFLYPGAPVCQDFGNAGFYYTSCVMNCIYDCAYCYLQGMYPSGHIVIFVNLEDYLREAEAFSARNPLYLCVSYDTDLLAMEPLLGFVREWSALAARCPGLTLEIRTKAAPVPFPDTLPVLGNVIYAWTLSPQKIIDAYEKRTPSLDRRLASAACAAAQGRHIRFCFDPVLRVENWQTLYEDLVRQAFAAMPLGSVTDAGIGVFRVSQAYINQMRRTRPGCPLVQFPFALQDGICCYPDSGEMCDFMRRQLRRYLPDRQIFG